ncbi:hypothetical protein [Streptosporangium saharense]|uniref:Uncharacterized protein n=1 Tax=Streptosporangium saharense TaxID=1706840 RepID=A0A7W7QSX5_9ACTN|nr:hypothetical protein [Streptosporangium saharense]MBB4918893.1 hypothetical protein [Streptosporangium saharense]
MGRFAGRRGPRDKPPFTRLVNLETGQVSQAALHEGERVYACGVRSCIGTTNGGRPFTRLRDGSQQKYVSIGYQVPEPPSQDRFHLCEVWEDTANGEITTADRLKGEFYVVVLVRIP